MYSYIYFDLDDTLVSDNPTTGKSELLDSGLKTYEKLKKKYPNVPVCLFTSRAQEEIKYPSVYSFKHEVGKDRMIKFIDKNLPLLPLNKLMSLRNLHIFIIGYLRYRKNSIAKILYLFLKHIVKGEEVLVIDDDERISSVFR